MKKYIVCFLAIIFCFLAISCSNNKISNNENTVDSSTQNSDADTTDISVQDVLNETDDKGTAVSEENGGECGELLPRKYRNNYYQIPLSFAQLIDSDTYSKWEKEYYANNYADNTNVMVMVAFVKEFDISKEDFERANLEYAKFIDEVYSHICLDPQDYADQEMQEIYNTEIIYTFDNDIINEYYLGIDYPFLNEYQYYEAIANGTYETRTTEFIDLAQM